MIRAVKHVLNDSSSAVLYLSCLLQSYFCSSKSSTLILFISLMFCSLIITDARLGFPAFLLSCYRQTQRIEIAINNGNKGTISW